VAAPAVIALKSIKYSEHEGNEKEWMLRKALFTNINLIVGRNASGKTRFLNVVYGLSQLLTNNIRPLWMSGTYDIEFAGRSVEYKYHLALHDSNVQAEHLQIGERTVLERKVDGSGTIWADELKRDITFKIPMSELATFVRRDDIQHPFLEPLHQWGSSVRRYEFGSMLGKHELYNHQLNFSDDNLSEPAIFPSTDPNKVVQLYGAAFQAFGDAFDKVILRDFASVGYPCDEVGAYPFEDIVLPTGLRALPMGIYVKERDLQTKTRQIEMSMGMHRCLALIININYIIMTKQTQCVIIDDIGEGLDFERSVKLIKLLIKKCRPHTIQLIMATNDRFVMNEVPLKHWRIINRIGSEVHILDEHNSKDEFDNFKYLGLSNFDFFASQGYLGTKKTKR
jgi:energy-coupling factor transporter ATP-binding protein EcfA2